MPLIKLQLRSSWLELECLSGAPLKRWENTSAIYNSGPTAQSPFMPKAESFTHGLDVAILRPPAFKLSRSAEAFHEQGEYILSSLNAPQRATSPFAILSAIPNLTSSPKFAVCSSVAPYSIFSCFFDFSFRQSCPPLNSSTQRPNRGYALITAF
jgi:hypothetical protein